MPVAPDSYLPAVWSLDSSNVQAVESSATHPKSRLDATGIYVTDSFGDRVARLQTPDATPGAERYPGLEVKANNSPAAGITWRHEGEAYVPIGITGRERNVGGFLGIPDHYRSDLVIESQPRADAGNEDVTATVRVGTRNAGFAHGGNSVIDLLFESEWDLPTDARNRLLIEYYHHLTSSSGQSRTAQLMDDQGKSNFPRGPLGVNQRLHLAAGLISGGGVSHDLLSGFGIASVTRLSAGRGRITLTDAPALANSVWPFAIVRDNGPFIASTVDVATNPPTFDVYTWNPVGPAAFDRSYFVFCLYVLNSAF